MATRRNLSERERAKLASRGLLSAEPPAVPDMDAERSRAITAALNGAVGAVPNIGSAVDAKPPLVNRAGLLSAGRPDTVPVGGVIPAGLLGVGAKKAGAGRGLLAGPAPAALAVPAEAQPSRSPLAQTGNFLDDFLFGGAAGERAFERRERERVEGRNAAHEAAWAEAVSGGGFDPNVYGRAMAARGFAPDMAGIVQLEGVTDAQDVRGQRGRTEQREVTAGAFAPVLGLPDEQRGAVLTGVLDYLESQGMGYSGPTDPAALTSAVGAGMGANAYLDNQRGDRALSENIRSNIAAEDYRNRDFGFRQEVDQRNFGYQTERDRADDAYRNSRAAAEDAYRRWQMENDLTRSDIEGRVLRKALEQGAENLTPEERAVYDRAVTVPNQGFGFGMMGGAMPGAAPQATAQPQPQSGDGRSPQSPARPMTDEDYARLPAGAYFVDPGDGQVYRR